MASDTNTNTENTPRRGRQPGQRGQSLDLRAYKTLMAFDFRAHGVDVPCQSDLADALIGTLRGADIF